MVSAGTGYYTHTNGIDTLKTSHGTLVCNPIFSKTNVLQANGAAFPVGYNKTVECFCAGKLTHGLYG